MKITLLIIFILATVAYSAQAKIEVKFNLTPATQIKDNNDNPTKEVKLNLSVTAKLDFHRDELNLNTSLGYEFWCEGDDQMFKNSAQMSTSKSNLNHIRLEYTTAKPHLWNSWEAGTKACTLNWTGTVAHTNTQTGTTDTVTISGPYSSTNSYTSPENNSSSMTNSINGRETFIMKKP